MSNFPTNNLGELIAYLIVSLIIYLVLGYVFIDLLPWLMLWIGSPR